MSESIPVLSFVGRSKSGKTTLLEKVIRELKGRGYRLAVIKHHYHAGVAVDVPGTDTYRFAQVGADCVIMAAPDQIMQMRRVTGDIALSDIVADVRDVDLIITEGYKRAGAPKIEVHRREQGSELVFRPEELVAVASDEYLDLSVPQFDLDDAAGLADFIEHTFLSSGGVCSGAPSPCGPTD
ncbi:MAG: molybdopterin-guanine dinucleotide biosynthesis protein B [Chloroflexi bacterium]|nr:molybdopterin-guanine dinucleotide biosynthesis protein B [Chloroflexota bacterium]